MQLLKPIHLIIGILGLIAFALTGQYMAIFLQGLLNIADGPRLLYRSSHLYLMWSSLVNLLVGSSFVVAATRGARFVQMVSSIAMLVGPALLIAGFFIESPKNDLQRPFCDAANYLALGGVILHVASSYLPRNIHASSEQSPKISASSHTQ